MFSRLTTTKMNRIFFCFAEDLTAAVTAKIAGVNRNTVNRYFRLIREKIVKYSIAEYNRLMNNTGILHAHTNDKKSIDKFLTFAKKRLAKFNGCSQNSLHLHLKECEFRYNHRGEDLFKLVKKIFHNY